MHAIRRTLLSTLPLLAPSIAAAGAAADEVAWLFNLRGGDVPYNPVCLAYGVVTPGGATLYVDATKVTPE